MVLARDVVGFETRGPVRAVLLRRRRRDRGPRRHRRHRRLLPAARRRRAGRAHRPRASTTAPPPARPSQCEGDDVYVVGAANSAGQAALNLARYAKRVVLVVRGATLETAMSQYLVERIQPPPTSRCAPDRGGGRRGATATSRRSPWPTGPPEPSEEVPTNWLFVFIGASPRTDWLGDDVVRDAQGLRRHGPGPARARPAPALAARPARRSRSRRACPACSPPATSGSTR